MATSVPQFNLKEVNNALIKIIKNPNIDFNSIYCTPDFATGGIITNALAVKESLRNGKGDSIRLRAKLEYIPDQNMIQATELPYSVFTNTVIEQLANLVNENPEYGIERVVDYTKKNADIRIYLAKGINPKKMVEKLYKDTSLENWFSINMILLDNGRFPRVFGWREACDAYITHIRECEKNIINFDLTKALARLNIVDGLILAAANIDNIVAIIRSSENPSEASTKLIAKYDFNEEQTKAILAMKLSSLTKIDAIKLNNEREELNVKIEQFRYLLNNESALNEELIKILREVADKFGDERRTKILNLSESDEDSAEAIVEEELGVMLFDNNMFRILKKDELQGARKGSKGTKVKPPKGANLINTIYTTNLGTVAAFSDCAKMYNFALADLEYNKDYSLYEVLSIQPEEKIMLLINSTSFSSYKHLITVSKNGFIKKSRVTEYSLRGSRGSVTAKLENNDKLVGVYLSSSDEDKIMIVSTSGNYNYYSLNEISSTGRATKGVKAIKLGGDEYIQSSTIVKESIRYAGILTVTSSGKGKITTVSDYSTTSRAVKGLQVMNLKDDSFSLVYAIPEDQDRLFVSCNNKAVLINVKDVPVQNRTTNGVRIIDCRDNSTNTIKIM